MENNQNILKAPFNFVPLADKVLLPAWGEWVSLDIPFRDAVSGRIDLDIMAETDIFVRNNSSDNSQSFCHIDNSYFIPGTTLKGAFRNVLEIIGFGKLTRVNKDSFAIRDLSKSTDGEAYKKLINDKPPHAGWLYLKNGRYYIDDCGAPGRISASEIDEKLGTKLEEFIRGDNFKKDECRNAKKKYETVLKKENNENYKDWDYLIRLEQRPDEYLVLTGQPGKREKNKGKHREFIFKKGPTMDKTGIPVSEEDIVRFMSIHKTSDNFTEFWRNFLEKGKPIPVFFQQTTDKHIYIGLSYMFKFPAAYSVWDALPALYKNPEDKNEPLNKPDIAELLFGYTGKDTSLKGRVQVGHAFACGENIQPKATESYTLSSPHPSYYPLYLKYSKQPVSWNCKEPIQIAGFKRYPVRTKAQTPSNKSDVNPKMQSKITPLPAGTRFTGCIMFHNLKPEELGALLYCINPAESEEKPCFHNIGGCKPFGYGKIKIIPKLSILFPTENVPADLEYYRGKWDELLRKEISETWKDTATIREFKAMANGIPENKERLFTYMDMSNNRNDNEFLKGKVVYTQGERLGSFTQILSSQVPTGKRSEKTDRANRENTNKHSDRKKLKNISEWEKIKGWKLELEEYEGIIKENRTIGINYPQNVRDHSKTIYCSYILDDFSKKAFVGDGVRFEIVDIYDTKVEIRITKIFRRRR